MKRIRLTGNWACFIQSLSSSFQWHKLVYSWLHFTYWNWCVAFTLSLLLCIFEYTQTYTHADPWRLFILPLPIIHFRLYSFHSLLSSGQKLRAEWKLHFVSIDGVSLIIVNRCEPKTTTTTRPTIRIRHQHSFKWNTVRIITSIATSV